MAALLTAAYVAWLALAQVNFFYPLWHDLIGIDHTIEMYAPQNRYKPGFEQTSKAERTRLFAGIVDAIHQQGEGLQRLVYHDAKGQPIDQLLRKPEIVHLRDVARLTDLIHLIGVTASIVTIALLLVVRRQRLSMPPPALQLLGLLLPLAAVAVAMLLIGPVKVFYRLHTLIFPPGHEWFFYYQDSLMSTMMKAPDLFGYIGLAWAALSLLLLVAFMSVVKRVSRSA